MLKLGISKQAVEQKIRMDSTIKASDLQNVILKKTEHPQNNFTKKGNYMPSLDEIRSTLQSLQRIN